MRRVSVALVFVLGVLCPTITRAAEKFPEQKAKLEQQLKAAYVPTTVVRKAVDKPGTVLLLRKAELKAVPANAPAYYDNVLKAGRLTHQTFGNILFKKDTIQDLAVGEPFYVLNAYATDSSVVVLLLSCNAYDNVVYKADVQFPFPKGFLADVTFSRVQEALAEVFEVAPPAGAPTVADPGPAPANQPAAQPAPPVETAAPAQPVTLKLGDTPDQVVAAMGSPDRIAKVANKELYFYKDMKITFVDGKISDIQ